MRTFKHWSKVVPMALILGYCVLAACGSDAPTANDHDSANTSEDKTEVTVITDWVESGGPEFTVYERVVKINGRECREAARDVQGLFCDPPTPTTVYGR